MVDRQEDVVARPLGLRGEHVDHAAGRIGDRRLAAGLARERLVERALETVEAVVVQSGEAEDVRCDAPLRIEAHLLRIEAESFEVLLLELGRLGGIGLPLQIDEVPRAVREDRIELVRIEAEDRRRSQRDPARILHAPRVGVDRGRLLADCERLARAVEDRSPPRRNLRRVLLLARGDAFERRGLHALQPHRPREGAREDEREEAEEQADAAVGEPLGHRLGGWSCTW